MSGAKSMFSISDTDESESGNILLYWLLYVSWELRNGMLGSGAARDKSNARHNGPVSNGTLNPRGLPLSPHFRDVVPL